MEVSDSTKLLQELSDSLCSDIRSSDIVEVSTDKVRVSAMVGSLGNVIHTLFPLNSFSSHYTPILRNTLDNFKHHFVSHLAKKYTYGGTIFVEEELSKFIPLFSNILQEQLRSVPMMIPHSTTDSQREHPQSLVRKVRELMPEMNGFRMRVVVVEALGDVMTGGCLKSRFLVGDETGTVTVLVKKSRPLECRFQPEEVLELFQCETVMHSPPGSSRLHLQIFVPSPSQVHLERFISLKSNPVLLLDMCIVPVCVEEKSLYVQLVREKETPSYHRLMCALRESKEQSGAELSFAVVKQLVEHCADGELNRLHKREELPSVVRELAMNESVERKRAHRRVINDYWHLPVGGLEFSSEEKRMELPEEACLRSYVERLGLTDALWDRECIFLNGDRDFAFTMDRKKSEPKTSAQLVQQTGVVHSPVPFDRVSCSSASGRWKGTSIASTSSAGSSSPDSAYFAVRDFFVCAVWTSKTTRSQKKKDNNNVRWCPLFDGYRRLSVHWPNHARALERVVSEFTSSGIEKSLKKIENGEKDL